MDIPAQLQPLDEYNQTLAQTCSSDGWQNPEPDHCYNVVVIGAGPAGLVVAAAAAGLGARVALVEKTLLGGDCLNVGCVPSKSILRAARARGEVQRASAFGIRLPDGETSVDFPAVMRRMRRLRAAISHHDSASRYQDELGVDVFFGHARFEKPGIIRVDDAELAYHKAVIATGARAYVPEIPGLEAAGFLTNETIFSLTELPRRLVVLGGGPIGCEMSQAFRRFGAQVTVVERTSHVLSREDPEAAEILQNALRRDGVRVMLDSAVVRVSPGSPKKVHVETPDGTETLDADAILVAAGRAPNVEDIGLETVGVAFDTRHGIRVDDHLRTDNRSIFAAGDCCMRMKFTHTADFAARIVIRNALFGFLPGRAKLSDLVVPWCTYTEPEIAHVGMYLDQAREQDLDAVEYRRDFADVDRAVAEEETDGFVKIIAKRRNGAILGATIVAPHAGDMISEITTAIKAGLHLGKLANVIHPYPTLAEAVRQAGDMHNRSRLTPLLNGILRRLLAWQRRCR